MNHNILILLAIIIQLIQYNKCSNTIDYSQDIQILLNQEGLTNINQPKFQCNFDKFQKNQENNEECQQFYKCFVDDVEITVILSKIQNGLEKLVLISSDKNKLPIDFNMHNQQDQNTLDSLIPEFDRFFGIDFFYQKEHMLYSELGFQLHKNQQNQFEYIFSFRYNCPRRQEIKNLIYPQILQKCEDFKNLQEKYNEIYQNMQELNKKIKSNYEIIYQSKIANKQNMQAQLDLRVLNFCIKNKEYIMNNFDFTNYQNKNNIILI